MSVPSPTAGRAILQHSTAVIAPNGNAGDVAELSHLGGCGTNVRCAVAQLTCKQEGVLFGLDPTESLTWCAGGHEA